MIHMKIKHIKLENFRIFDKIEVDFVDFSILTGTNGIGKTTLLGAVSLLCSSLDYNDPKRLKAYLGINIKHYGTSDQRPGFLAEALFEHEGKNYEVVLNQDGWVKNEILNEPFWFGGMTYFSSLDVDRQAFQLKLSLWPDFAKSYETIMGFSIDPDVYEDTMLKRIGEEADIVTGFYLNKPQPQGRSRLSIASGGEKKMAKALAGIICLPKERRPHIVFTDEIERQIDYRRHLVMMAEIQRIFEGTQVIASTHSETIRRDYEPKSNIIDLEKILGV